MSRFETSDRIGRTGRRPARRSDGQPPGAYSFRLDAVSQAEPDEDFTEGPSVAFDVAPAPAPPKKKFPWWIVIVLGVLLLVVIIVFFALK